MRLDISSTFKLASGQDIPLLGLGVFQNKEYVTACEAALKAGYRHIDTAQAYRNEEQVGAAVKASGVPRESIFISSKIIGDGEQTTDSVAQSLENLDLGYIDLYIIHSGHGGKDVRLQTYKTLLELSGPGEPLRGVGVSNYSVKHLEEIREAGFPMPAVNQIELHPFCQQKTMVDYCRANKIAIQAYCPLVRGEFRDPVIQEISKKYNKTPAQVLIRWSIQHGFMPIPNSSNSDHVRSNAEIYDFKLSDDAMEKLNALDPGTSGATSWSPVHVK